MTEKQQQEEFAKTEPTAVLSEFPLSVPVTDKEYHEIDVNGLAWFKTKDELNTEFKLLAPEAQKAILTVGTPQNEHYTSRAFDLASLWKKLILQFKR